MSIAGSMKVILYFSCCSQRMLTLLLRELNHQQRVRVRVRVKVTLTKMMMMSLKLKNQRLRYVDFLRFIIVLYFLFYFSSVIDYMFPI